MNRIMLFLENKYIRDVFLLVIFAWFTLWAWSIPGFGVTGGPDEQMRYLVPQYIYHQHVLPTGYDKDVILAYGNWSYAFYPQLLGAIVSSIFMSIMSTVKDSPHALLFAARMTSVLFATIATYFVGKTVEKVYKKDESGRIYPYIAMLVFAFWPQVAFLAGYVNNDIIALCGVSIIIYAMVLGYKDKWNIKSSLVLAAGFVICLLGYSNSYGFILFGFVYFIISLLQHDRKKMSHVLQCIGAVLLVCLLLAGPFFLRNALIYRGDILGMHTFNMEQTKYEDLHHVKMQKNYSEVTGGGVKDFLNDKQYWDIQEQSFIAKFGAMNIAPSNEGLVVYKGFVLGGLLGLLWMIYRHILARVRQRGEGLIKNGYKKIILSCCIVLSCLVTVALSAYYSVRIDYQPQGRYVIYLIVPLIVYCLYGIKYIADRVLVEGYRNTILLILTTIYVSNTFVIFSSLILPLR